MNGERTLGSALLAGAMAGVAGGAALLLAERLGRATVLPAGSRTAGAAQEAVHTFARDRGIAIPTPATAAAGIGVQLAYCALWGAAYGAFHRRLQTPSLVDALLLAGTAYAAAMSKGGLMPRLGLSAPMREQNLSETAVDFGSHLAFGVTTASVLAAAR